MTHDRTVRDEFTRQAADFAQAPALRAADVTERLAACFDDRRRARLLDVACGPGLLFPSLSARVNSIVGLDLTARTLQLARANCERNEPAAFVQGLAVPAPFATGAFDAAVLRLALHHFDQPEAALAEVRRLLQRNGRLVVLDLLTSPDPNVAAFHNAIERLRDPSHTSLYPRAELRNQIEGAGFTVRAKDVWEMTRRFSEWAQIIAEPVRMTSLEMVLRQLARAGADAGIALREEDGELRFTYQWGLFVCDAT